MSLRLLVIAAREELRRWFIKHAEIEWPDAVFVEHRLGEEPPLDVEFTAAGFDAAVLVAASGAADDPSIALAAQLRDRAEFAPLLLIVLEDSSSEASPSAPPPLPGFRRIVGRKIDRQELARALEGARGEHRAALRAHPDFEHRYRFGSVMIRGHRCIRQVGSGGMCKIYLAESERAGSLVVLKVFSQVPDVSERLLGFDRFLQEYEIVAALAHPNVVRIHDLGIADDHAYIAMEHCPAGDLRRRLKTPLPVELALHYLAQIAAALEAIHAVGVLHRDLKPANIMLRSDGSLCLIDFGLAKMNDIDIGITGSREIFGTPFYMSPEQGHAEEVDARSDLYSLGVIFYEMLTGRKPFNGASAMEVIYKHRRFKVPAVEPRFAPYADTLRRLLAKAPGDRFQSARELREHLAELQSPVGAGA